MNVLVVVTSVLLVIFVIALSWAWVDVREALWQCRVLASDLAALQREVAALEERMPKPVPDDAADLALLAVHGPWAPSTEEIPVVGKHRAPR